MLFRSHSLSKRLVVPQFDGEVGRQATALFDTIKAAMPLPSSVGVIIDIGNNGYVGTETLRAIFSMLATQPRVIVVNASVPRRWESTNNELIASMALEFPNVRVADWHTAATGHPSYFVADGVHLSTNGIRAYTDCVVAAATVA
mgnify:CR=1 FL=1